MPKRTDLSLPKIGEYGNRDHTTVHACDKISNDINTNESLKEIINELRKQSLKINRRLINSSNNNFLMLLTDKF